MPPISQRLAVLIAVVVVALAGLGYGIYAKASENSALHADISGGSRRPVPEVRLAALGNDAGIVGCADLARRV